MRLGQMWLHPQNMDYFAMRCPSSDIVYRTDVTDAATEDTLQQDVQDGVVASNVVTPKYITDTRFVSGDTVCSVKSVKPTATLIITWVR